jgi:hypothetical protein
MPGGTRPRAPWQLWALIGTAVLVAIALARVPGHQRVVATLGMIAVGVIACWGRVDRLAWCWGFLLPIDFLTAVPTQILDVVRYGGLAWLCLELTPDLTPARRPIVTRLALLVGAVALVRGLGSLARGDRFGMFIAAVMLLGAVTAPFVAVRVRAHMPLLAGFMTGVLLSAVVSVMQSLDITTLQEGLPSSERYPGLASTTMLITWHLAFGLIIACYFLVARGQPSLYRATAVALIPIGSMAMLINGAQGGFIGMAFAALAVAAFGWRLVTWRQARPFVLGGAAVAVAVAAVVVGFSLATPTIDELGGEGGYGNTVARLDVNQQGLEELIAHPAFGMGRTNFAEKHEAENGSLLAPHFLPLEAGVTSGIVGFALAAVLLWTLLVVIWRGPVGRRPEAWLGLALCAAMFGNALTETGGPFTGLPRFALLLVAVVACQGEPWPAVRGPAADQKLSADTPSPAR